MKIIQVPYCYHPDPVGGTEVYVEALAKSLLAHGVESVICAPTEKQNETYIRDGIKVRRFKTSKELDDLAELYGEGDIEAARNFAKILDEEKPDIVHLHAFTIAVSLRLVREAKRRNIPTFFTYHTPAVSCQRGTLMYMGKEVCIGKLYPTRCARCALEGLGLPKAVAGLFALMPKAADDILGKINLSGGIFTAIRMKGLVLKHINVFGHLMEDVDHITAVCDWARDLLLHNNIPAKKIAVIRHGLPDSVLKENEKTSVSFVNTDAIKLIYVGRLSPVKGIDILIRAVSSLPDLPIEFHVYGIIQSEAEERYSKRLRQLTRGDSRIVFKNTVSNDKIIPLLQNYDLLAAPSQWFETGPLVVLEAFAAGIPVLGSNLGGISELVTNGVNGILVKHDSVKRWRGMLQRVSEERPLINRLRSGIRPPKTMSSTAYETGEIYKKVTDGACH